MLAPQDPPAPDPDERIQMNVRVPRSLRDRIDARRAAKGMSRDEWVTNALGYALSKHPSNTRPTRQP